MWRALVLYKTGAFRNSSFSWAVADYNEGVNKS